MPTFISHSFQNKPEFENIADALDQRGVPYWNPAEVKSGASLREQLRAAVEQCRVCIFVATRDAIESSWCGAELGAFWGTGKPIIVYLAEPSLSEDDLPPLVHGDVWERRISRVADRAKELLAQNSPSEPQTISKGTPLTNLTAEQLERLIIGAVSLAAASTKSDSGPASFQEVEQAVKGAAGKFLAGARATEYLASNTGDDWHNKILWVDDRPENNVYERQAMESMGLEFTLALSTTDALRILASRRFAAIISDMGRKEGPREGYVLLEAVREKDKTTPFFIYAGSRAPQHQREAALRGAQGTTNVPQELMDMVISALPIGN
jgi:CheY-like chemotaxis protein